jgi:hypothetical protein
MQDLDKTIADLGNEPPLIADGRSGPPDRREVSARWLSGTFLTGVTSSVLMGVALFAALDGREQLAVPPEIAELVGVASKTGEAGESAKTARLATTRQMSKAKDRRRMEVSMVTKVGDRDVIKAMPFVQIKMALGAGHTTTRSYPAFDPLDVFAEDGEAQTASSALAGQIYGVKVESEMSLKTVDFPLETATFDEKSDLTADEVERSCATTGEALTDGADLRRCVALRRAATIRRLACGQALTLLWHSHRPRKRLGDATRTSPRTDGSSMPRTSFPSTASARSQDALRRGRLCRRRRQGDGQGAMAMLMNATRH